MSNVQDEIKELKARIAALEAAQPSNEPEPVPQIDSLPRDARGRVVRPIRSPEEEDADYHRRQIAAREAREADEAFEYAKAREGLTDGMWRDPFGIVRRRDGTVAKNFDPHAEALAAVNEGIRAEHHARLVADGVIDDGGRNVFAKQEKE